MAEGRDVAKDVTPTNPRPIGLCTGGIINVCGGSGPSPECALYLRSMTLYNLGTADPAVIVQGPDEPLVEALGNYTSMMWNFAYPR